MKSLKHVKLSDVAEINPRLQCSLESNDAVSFVPMASLSAEQARIIIDDVRPYQEVSKGYTPICDGDILIAKITPCFENGKIAQAKLSRPIGFGSTEFHVIRPNKNRLENRFIHHFLRQKYVRTDGERRMTGSGGQRRVPANYFAELTIPLPPLPEQRRIAAILDKAEALRAKRRAALAKLDQLAQSIFLEMFGDPVSNPKCWPLKKFLNIGKLDRGVSKYRPRNAPELLNGPFPLVQTGDVANSDGYIREYKQTYSEIGLKQSRMWQAGTLCITIAANIAKTGILTFDACFPDSVVGFTPNDLCNSEFVRMWLSFLQKMLEDSAPESAQKNINLEILRNLDIPLPPLPLQQAFAHRIEKLESLKTAHRASLAKLDALFASLQDRAFRGEL